MKRLLMLIAGLTSVAVLTAGQSPAATAPKVMHLLDVSGRTTPAFDAGNGEPRPGDRVFFVDGLYAWNGSKRGARVGRVESTLTFLSSFGRAGASVEISGQMFLSGGSIYVIGIGRVTGDLNRFSLPIVGGTGRYAGARGSVDLRDLSRSGDTSALDIRLLAS